MKNPILGIGGIFLRSADPERLTSWYREHLAITPAADHTPWSAGGGLLVFAAFKKDSEYYPAAQSVMINFRVADLDQLLVQLGSRGVRIDDKRMDEPYGKFAWVYDCDGNKIELWQEK